MAYRNGVYVAFDGNGSTNPTKGDLKYYGLLQRWNSSNNFELNFSDSHKKTYQVKDSSLRTTLQSRLLQRMKNSKSMLLIISQDTNWDRGMLNFEIEKAVDYYKIPLIIAYTGYQYILSPYELSHMWPKALSERIHNKTAKCIHIPFKQVVITSALMQFSIHTKELTGPDHFYNKTSYENWGLL